MHARIRQSWVRGGQSSRAGASTSAAARSGQFNRERGYGTMKARRQSTIAIALFAHGL
ncbi:hypothetical protein [Saccharothrix syringae]|uniref:hypothetical protein n=1 Tax=Saccharothrix syringae TaxID=103733 RepID=UPI00129386A6|nr:hypothetical protein [Saccharothrix syringae]